jgi:hypothetical protein
VHAVRVQAEKSTSMIVRPKPKPEFDGMVMETVSSGQSGDPLQDEIHEGGLHDVGERRRQASVCSDPIAALFERGSYGSVVVPVARTRKKLNTNSSSEHPCAVRSATNTA